MIPPNTTAKLLIQRDVMISAYPSLEVQGGADATINLQYGEALYDKDGRKGDRNLIADRQLRGFHDTFIADGRSREFAPLWWRTFRYLEIEVENCRRAAHAARAATPRDPAIRSSRWRAS